ncbi:hypothetical protein [Vibrio kanaloae]|uniref:hypothetical protein n=1 Tax=Vibrio kanaloae TaxID=170673 RepID=UPI0012485BDC|nr:hypothetical protein [Vibrio kanaloae]KAB0463166.1 hypothetical protein F7Q89_14805 [Vibrio kanaloae]
MNKLPPDILTPEQEKRIEDGFYGTDNDLMKPFDQGGLGIESAETVAERRRGILASLKKHRCSVVFMNTLGRGLSGKRYKNKDFILGDNGSVILRNGREIRYAGYNIYYVGDFKESWDISTKPLYIRNGVVTQYE